MDFTCQYCDKSFSSKGNLEYHIKTAKKCIANRKGDKDDNSQPKCEFCGKLFAQSYIKKHVSSCKGKISIDLQNQSTENGELKLTVDKLKLKLDKLEQELEFEKHSNDKLRKKNMELRGKNRKLKNNNVNLLGEVNNKKGIIEGLAISKPPQTITNNNNTNTTTNNISSKVLYKLSDIDITQVEPLTKEIIKIKTKDYSYGQFKKREKGVADLIENSATYKNDNSEKTSLSYAFVDGHFYKVNENRTWELDKGEKVISTFLDALKPMVKRYHGLFVSTEDNSDKPKIDPFEFLTLKSDPPETKKYNRNILKKYDKEQKNREAVKSEEFASPFISNQDEEDENRMHELHTQVKSELEPRLRR